MSFRSITLFIALLLLAFSNAFAQFPVQTDTSKTKDMAKVEVFSANNYFGKESRNTEQNWAIKVNPILMLNGDLPLFIERRITKSTSVELAIGFTTRDYMLDLFEDEIFSESIDAREFSPGLSFQAGFRYFPSSSEEAIQGFYLAPEIRNRTYNSDITFQCNTSLPSATAYNEVRKYTDYKLSIGYQELDGFSEDVVLDYYVSFGMRSRDINGFECTLNDLTGFEEIVTRKENKFVPVFGMGVKIGLSFK